MKSTNKLLRFVTDADYRFVALAERGFYTSMSDEAYINRMYKAKFGRLPDLQNPRSYTEKLQWMKLHDRHPEYTMLVDKYAVKDYVAKQIGSEYIIPTLGVWDSFDEITFDQLPNQFVLKTTHDSGGVVICKDKSCFNMAAAKKKLERSLRNNYYSIYREYPYKAVKPRIIAEAYLEDAATAELRDYKFFTFDGKVRLLFIASDRQTPREETKFDFFDADFNHLPFTNGHPNAATPPQRPVMFEKMKSLAEQLAKGFPHVRVDLYEVDGKIYFGELTFCHYSGFVPFDPEEWDYTIGSWLILPDKG